MQILINFAGNKKATGVTRDQSTMAKFIKLFFAPSKKRFLQQAGALLVASLLAACSGGNGGKLPDNFKTLSTVDQMEYLMGNMEADSVARFICNAAMGKVYNVRLELQPALAYAYEKYDEDNLVKFQVALEQFQDSIPLDQQVKLTKLLGIEDLDQYAYNLGLSYVGTIREEQKTKEQIKQELSALRKECASDPEFYTRFMKGFKTALTLDRHRDLDDKIYQEFINYPDNI